LKKTLRWHSKKRKELVYFNVLQKIKKGIGGKNKKSRKKSLGCCPRQNRDGLGRPDQGVKNRPQKKRGFSERTSGQHETSQGMDKGGKLKSDKGRRRDFLVSLNWGNEKEKTTNKGQKTGGRRSEVLKGWCQEAGSGKGGERGAVQGKKNCR